MPAGDFNLGAGGVDVAAVTTSMTISGPAIPIFCMYLVAAERQGADISKLDGTLQTDIFKEYIAQKEWLFRPEPHLRLIGDLMEYCAREIPKYKPLSVSGYHIREAGSTAAQELAYTLADGFGYYVRLVYGTPTHASGGQLLLATFFFGLQVYCDFSGYSHIAVGERMLVRGWRFWVRMKSGNLTGSRMKNTGVLLPTRSQLPSSV